MLILHQLGHNLKPISLDLSKILFVVEAQGAFSDNLKTRILTLFWQDGAS